MNVQLSAPLPSWLSLRFSLKREVSPIAIFPAVDLINRQCDSFVAESENQLSLKLSAALGNSVTRWFDFLQQH